MPTDLPDPHDTARLALACLDLTRLNDADDAAAIAALCQRALGPAGQPAALCVWPRFVAQARAALPHTVRVAAVANFPVGACDPGLALAETRAIVAAGADEVDFLKTSTGKLPSGATPAAAQVMLQAIAAHPRGAAVGFKASGGIRTVADAAVYIALVRKILGESALTTQRLRFGASGLLDDIEAVLAGRVDGNSAAADSY
jgi:deoxyribose-phosphate aldolase